MNLFKKLFNSGSAKESESSECSLPLSPNDYVTVTIPEGVVSLDNDSIEEYGYAHANRIVLPSSIKKLDYAFEGCKDLVEVDFANVCNLKTIESSTFENLHFLKEVVLPDGVKEIEDDAFCSCKHLEKVVMPSTLEKLGLFAELCENLRIVDMSKVHALKKLSNSCLCECPMFSFAIPQNVEKVETTFNASLKELYIPSSVNKIGSINEEEEHDVNVYLYSGNIKDIESLCYDTKTLFVLPEHFAYYKAMIEDLDKEEQPALCKMSEDKIKFYQQ